MFDFKGTLIENESFLKDHSINLQGAIFNPAKKEHAWLLFFQMDESYDPQNLLIWLASLGNNSDTKQGLYITSSANQHDVNTDNTIGQEELSLSIFLTSEGLRLLKGDQRGWNAIIQHLEENAYDIPTEKELPLTHFVVRIAHSNTFSLSLTRDRLSQYFERTGGRLIATEKGRVYRKKFFSTQKNGFTIEHFGYADGLSNPWITTEDTLIKGAIPKPSTKWNPTCAIEEFIVKEPNDSNRSSYGSYLVYRKIRQDVNRFIDATDKLAKATGYSSEEAGALAIGRKRDGSPLALENTTNTFKASNDFDYTSGKCPFFAHIRKVNTREWPEGETPKRMLYPMLRRGITYGDRALNSDRYSQTFDPTKKVTNPVGLLFLSYQNDIRKFQKMVWQSQSDENTLDPILGNFLDPNKVFKHDIPKGGQENSNIPYEGFGNFIANEGGLNLYVPSIRFFKDLLLEPTV